jgi:UDP-glucose 4-epimerase
MDNIFDGKILLVTGGTGSLVNADVKRFVDSNISEIRILSRYEKKTRRYEEVIQQ